MQKMNEAVLLLGSNIDPVKNLKKALNLLNKMSNVVVVSRVYKTKAVGMDGPDFLNQAVMIKTDLNMTEIKSDLIAPIEYKLKRIRTADKYAPRPIDIDLILFNSEIIDQKMWEFKFIALPLNDILPDIEKPLDGRKIKDILAELK